MQPFLSVLRSIYCLFFYFTKKKWFDWKKAVSFNIYGKTIQICLNSWSIYSLMNIFIITCICQQRMKIKASVISCLVFWYLWPPYIGTKYREEGISERQRNIEKIQLYNVNLFSVSTCLGKLFLFPFCYERLKMVLI